MKRKWLTALVSAAIAVLFICGWSGSSYSESTGGVPLDIRGPGSNTPQQILDPATIPKFQNDLVIPPAMPSSGDNYYEIAVRQFRQQILPAGYPSTTVWSYGSANHPGTAAEGGTFNYPAFSIEAEVGETVTVKWINDLVDKNGNYLPHLLPVDQTLHWANPRQQCIDGPPRTDCRGLSPGEYKGPVPIITHVHGAHTYEQYDGYPEAWYLPAARNIPPIYATGGSLFEDFKAKAEADGLIWEPGSAIFKYPNDQRATTLWYHDHTLGMTRLNVYAGPTGFYLLRGGDDDLPGGMLPGPAPQAGDSAETQYFEIPIVMQDRTFSEDGSLFYPSSRSFFDGFRGPTIPGNSDVSRRWNPEFFGNTIVVNGKTWPKLEAEPRRYRLRLLNGSQSRFLILQFSDPAVEVWQIGAEGGFLPEPIDINAEADGRILLGPAERADIIVDFSGVAGNQDIRLLNLGPDEPFGGGEIDVDFPRADPATTGQVMQFRVAADPVEDMSTPPDQLELPEIDRFEGIDSIRRVSLNEEESGLLCVEVKKDGREVVIPCTTARSNVPFAPVAALLGTVEDGNGDPVGVPYLWMDEITENPQEGATETWEMYNFTEDAHPIHIHLVQFQVEGRQAIGGGDSIAGSNDPMPWETGFKDTVIVYPGEITRVTARFDLPGLYVWHCHILEHEDNEMMRPYYVGPMPAE